MLSYFSSNFVSLTLAYEMRLSFDGLRLGGVRVLHKAETPFDILDLNCLARSRLVFGYLVAYY